MTDIIHRAIQAEVARRDLSAYRLSQLCGGKPNKESVARYLAGRASLTSPLLSRMLAALEMRVAHSDSSTRGTGKS